MHYFYNLNLYSKSDGFQIWLQPYINLITLNVTFCYFLFLLLLLNHFNFWIFFKFSSGVWVLWGVQFSSGRSYIRGSYRVKRYIIFNIWCSRLFRSFNELHIFLILELSFKRLINVIILKVASFHHSISYSPSIYFPSGCPFIGMSLE